MDTTCEIHFKNNPTKLMFSGESINGTVCLRLSSIKYVRGVYVSIRGYAKTGWFQSRSEHLNGKAETVNDFYTASELCLDEKKYLFGSENGK